MLRDVEGFCMVSTPHLWWFYGFLLTHLLWGLVSIRAAVKAVATRFASLEPGTNKVVTVSWAATTRLDFRWFYQTYQVYPVDIFWFGARIYIDSLEKRFWNSALVGLQHLPKRLVRRCPCHVPERSGCGHLLRMRRSFGFAGHQWGNSCWRWHSDMDAFRLDKKVDFLVRCLPWS